MFLASLEVGELFDWSLEFILGQGKLHHSLVYF
jgi:hypothetical protein